MKEGVVMIVGVESWYMCVVAWSSGDRPASRCACRCKGLRPTRRCRRVGLCGGAGRGRTEGLG